MPGRNTRSHILHIRSTLTLHCLPLQKSENAIEVEKNSSSGEGGGNGKIYALDIPLLPHPGKRKRSSGRKSLTQMGREGEHLLRPKVVSVTTDMGEKLKFH